MKRSINFKDFRQKANPILADVVVADGDRFSFPSTKISIHCTNSWRKSAISSWKPKKMWIPHLFPHAHAHKAIDGSAPNPKQTQNDDIVSAAYSHPINRPNTLSKPLTIDCLIFVPCTNLPMRVSAPQSVLQRLFYVVLTIVWLFLTKMLRIIVTVLPMHSTRADNDNNNFMNCNTFIAFYANQWKWLVLCECKCVRAAFPTCLHFTFVPLDNSIKQ